VLRSVGDPGSARPTGLFSCCVSVDDGRVSLYVLYRVSLHGGRGEAHARLPQTVVACMGEHLRAACFLDVFDFFNASLLALRNRAGGVQILLVGEERGNVRCDLL
jgi:hypothetical protein